MPKSPRPSNLVAKETAYTIARGVGPIELYLDGNEGTPTPADFLKNFTAADLESVRRYPTPMELEEEIARRFKVPIESVLVSSGGDEALDRLCRAVLGPGREVLTTHPTFEMISRYARLSGASIRQVPWLDGEFPTDMYVQAITGSTDLAVLVSPNNPTGFVISAEALRSVAEKSPLVLLDHAYVEFADACWDLTQLAMSLGNVVVLRTFSKAYGLAGLRVGYVLGPPEVLKWMRAAGGPFPWSGLSLRLALKRLKRSNKDVKKFVKKIRQERRVLENGLKRMGIQVFPSHGNFIFLKLSSQEAAVWLHEALAGLGISVRRFLRSAGIENCLRLTCPGNLKLVKRVLDSFSTIYEPEAILFDMDGVIADESQSYRLSIQETVAEFGIAVSIHEISVFKARGNANNDWELSREILASKGRRVSLKKIIEVFERIYQGTPDNPGLRRTEKLIPDRKLLENLAECYDLGIVTGRPRADAHRFLEENQLEKLFKCVVCMEDAPLKPDPAPFRLALRKMRVRRAWAVGDTPDDIVSARGCRILPLGILAPGEMDPLMAQAMLKRGAARVLKNLNELEAILR